MNELAGSRVEPKQVVFFAWLSRRRFLDVLVLQGSPLMGTMFTLRGLTLQTIADLLLFFCASFFLVAHVFSFNDWADAATELDSVKSAKYPWLQKGFGLLDIRRLSFCLAISSLLLFTRFSLRTELIAVSISGLGIFYSYPGMNAKSIPLLSSAIHLAGGVLHFLLGYSLFQAIDRGGIAIGLYFALIFMAGHLNQEIRDYEEDRANGINTNTVRFGRRRTFSASFLLFTLSYGYLFWLASEGFVPGRAALLIVLYPVHAMLFWGTFRAGLTSKSVVRLQAGYRIVYGVIGFVMAVVALLK